jgi:long-chain acyl-CoA synthetase
VRDDDSFLSFLPLSHMYERTVGYYLAIMAGAQVAFARSANQLVEDLAEVKPTLLVTVPRLLERVYNRVEQRLAKGNPLSRILYRLTIRCGWQRFEWQQRRRRWHSALLVEPLLQHMIGGKIRNRFGGRLRLMVSGGAALPFTIARTFIALRLPILQGYGLSETSPQVCVNRRDENEPHSVGTALAGIELRTDTNGELLVRGPCVMLGYWNNPTATAAAIDGEGWLHTGDQAAIVDGRIYITGRLKEIIVLSNGEKVPPAEMEGAIALDPLIEQVIIVGEQRAYLSALLVVNDEEWRQLAHQCGVDPATSESLNQRSIQRQVLTRINRQLHDFPGYAKVRRVHLTLTPWDMENGLMTATMKLKRSAIIAFYRDVIEAMYHDAER